MDSAIVDGRALAFGSWPRARSDSGTHLVRAGLDSHQALHRDILPERVTLTSYTRSPGTNRQQYFCPVDNEIVERNEMVKGYEYAKERYVQFSEDELKKLEAEKSDRLDIVEFVPEESVDFIYIEKTYYLGPDKGGDRAYKLLSEAMKHMERIAVGRYDAGQGAARPARARTRAVSSCITSTTRTRFAR